MTPRDKAFAAERLLDDPVFKEALEAIRMQIVQQIESSPMGDVDTHHEAALSLQLLRRIKVQLERFVQDQKVNEHKQKQDAFIERMKRKLA